MMITELSKKGSKNIIGLMSGTSCDGLDLALVKVSGYGIKTRYELLQHDHQAYSDDLKSLLFKIMNPEKSNLIELSQANFYLARKWAGVIMEFLKKNKISANDIDLIGSHGHTIYHHPQIVPMLDDKVSSTLQIGDPAVIAQLTGITTIGDFRVADVALGGQGAPLVPYFDWLSFSRFKQNILALNIGGIANITFIPSSGNLNRVIAFDTGPGNMLIDQLMIRLYERPYDLDGKIAAHGKFSQRLFDYLVKTDTYPQAMPPKSTGREHYDEKFVIELLRKAIRWRVMEPDIIHTVTKYTGYTIWQAYEKYIQTKVTKLYVGGGGVHNKFLMDELDRNFKEVEILNVSDAGINEDFKEAICFAVLANECIHGQAAGLPNVTGAKHSAILGKICSVGKVE